MPVPGKVMLLIASRLQHAFCIATIVAFILAIFGVYNYFRRCFGYSDLRIVTKITFCLFIGGKILQNVNLCFDWFCKVPLNKIVICWIVLISTARQNFYLHYDMLFKTSLTVTRVKRSKWNNFVCLIAMSTILYVTSKSCSISS